MNKYNYCIIHDTLYYIESELQKMYLGIDVFTNNNVIIDNTYSVVKIFEKLDFTSIKNVNNYNLLNITKHLPYFKNQIEIWTWLDFKFNDDLVPFIFKTNEKINDNYFSNIFDKLTSLLKSHYADITEYRMYPYIVEIQKEEYIYHFYLKVNNDRNNIR